MVAEFKQYIARHKLIRQTDSVLVAVSGGADSMCLATLLIKSGYTIGIAHCNFGLRGAESDWDEAFVKEFAEKQKLEFFVKRFDTKKISKEQKTSIEETARNLRYEWFEQIMADEGFDLLATAHNADDNTETFLLNLIKGRGLKGQTGIVRKRKNIVRPLLFADKEEVIHYCEKNEIAYRTDSSNTDTDFQRNFVRHKIVPLMLELNPSLNKAIKNEINYRRAASEVFQVKLNKEIADLSTPDSINLKALKDKPEGVFALFNFIETMGFNFSKAQEIIESRHSGRQFLSETHQAVTHGDYLLVKTIGKSSSETFTVNEQGSVKTSIELNISEVMTKEVMDAFNKNIVYFDSSKAKFPLMLRHWQIGDFIYPSGMTGKKKISDFFIDNKFSLFDKQNAWLLCSGSNILWIIGWRADKRFMPNDKTTQYLKVELIP